MYIHMYYVIYMYMQLYIMCTCTCIIILLYFVLHVCKYTCTYTCMYMYHLHVCVGYDLLYQHNNHYVHVVYFMEENMHPVEFTFVS